MAAVLTAGLTVGGCAQTTPEAGNNPNTTSAALRFDCGESSQPLQPGNPDYDLLVPQGLNVKDPKFIYRVFQPNPRTIEVDKYEYVGPAQLGKQVQVLGQISLSGGGDHSLSIDNDYAHITLSVPATATPTLNVKTCDKKV